MLSLYEIESFRSIATPFYYYNLNVLDSNLRELNVQAEKFDVKIHYALKANNNIRILTKIREAGLGADCVSGEEIKRALQVGFHPDDIVFAGVGKTDEEISLGIINQISCFNCESIHELIVIDQIAGEMGEKVNVALRINPDYDGQTHNKITTGTRHNKFGIQLNEINDAIILLKNLNSARFKGLHFHIGSQITDMNVFLGLSKKINQIQDHFIGAGLTPEILNLGGGLGVDYNRPENQSIPDYNQFFLACLSELNRLPGQAVYFEPGRSIVAQCGNLISRVLFLKKNHSATFAIIDAGMNNLMRPALYNVSHKIQNLTGSGQEALYHVAGPVCESSDVFAKEIVLPKINRGDLIAIKTCGAYGEVMASSYNLKAKCASIYSDELTITSQV